MHRGVHAIPDRFGVFQPVRQIAWPVKSAKYLNRIKKNWVEQQEDCFMLRHTGLVWLFEHVLATFVSFRDIFQGKEKRAEGSKIPAHNGVTMALTGPCVSGVGYKVAKQIRVEFLC